MRTSTCNNNSTPNFYENPESKLDQIINHLGLESGRFEAPADRDHALAQLGTKCFEQTGGHVLKRPSDTGLTRDDTRERRHTQMSRLATRAFIAYPRERRLAGLGVGDGDILRYEGEGMAYRTRPRTPTWLQYCPVPYWLVGRATIKSVFTLLKPHAPRPTSNHVP